MSRVPLLAVSFVTGAGAWLLVSLLGHGPTPLQSGVLNLFVLGLCGFGLSFWLRELRWETLAGIYAGQLVSFVVQAIFGSVGEDPLHLVAGVVANLALQPLYLLCANLATAGGGVLGAGAIDFVRGNWSAPSKQT